MTTSWQWSDRDIGWELVRYQGETGNKGRYVVPASFIQGFWKGDEVKTDGYMCKVFLSEDIDKITPTKYLEKSAAPISVSSDDKPSENFGSPGLYRATVYNVKGQYSNSYFN